MEEKGVVRIEREMYDWLLASAKATDGKISTLATNAIRYYKRMKGKEIEKLARQMEKYKSMATALKQ